MAKKSILRQIVAMGGAGFEGAENKLLNDYILRLTKKRRPKICFIGTASGDSPEYIRAFHHGLGRRARTSHLALFQRDATGPVVHLLAQDVIYVGGGNTANLLAIWRVHGIDRILRAAWRRGIILCGASAGMICWFECCVTDSYGPLAALKDGLGFLPGSACPHYDGEKERRPTFRHLVAGGFPTGLAADDGAAIHFVGRKIFRCVSSRSGAQVYQVSKIRDKAVEESLPMMYLGAQAKNTN